MKMSSNKFKRTLNLLACSASVAFSPAQANCLSLGEINSSQLVAIYDDYINVCRHGCDTVLWSSLCNHVY